MALARRPFRSLLFVLLPILALLPLTSRRSHAQAPPPPGQAQRCAQLAAGAPDAVRERLLEQAGCPVAPPSGPSEARGCTAGVGVWLCTQEHTADTAELSCPPDTTVIGGGFDTFFKASSLIGNRTVIRNEPNGSRTGWVVTAAKNFTSAGRWEIDAICAPSAIVGRVEVVRQSLSLDGKGSGKVRAACPAEYRATAGGFTFSSRMRLLESRPDEGFAGWWVGADNTSHLKVTLTAVAICLPASALVGLRTEQRSARSHSDAFLRPNDPGCRADEQRIGGGMWALNSGPDGYTIGGIETSALRPGARDRWHYVGFTVPTAGPVSRGASIAVCAKRFTLPSLRTGLVGWWPFDEGRGDVARDHSGRGNDGTFTPFSAWNTGRFGTAAIFEPFSPEDPRRNYVRAGVNGMPAADAPQSISLWFSSFGQAAPATQQAILALTNVGLESGIFLGFRNGGGGKLIAWKYEGEWLANAPPPSGETWHHVVFTSDGREHRLYVDGTWHGPWRTTPNGATPAELTFGASLYRGQPTEYYLGRLDDVRIYTRVLSEAEIRALDVLP